MAACVAGVFVFQFLVGTYGGYFGAGMGILMLAALGIIGLTDIHQMNGLKNVLAVGINGIAAISFWSMVAAVLSGLVGRYLYAHIPRTINGSLRTLEALEETRQHHMFFVAITGGERKFNDLTNPDGGWILRLTDSAGNETAPEEIVAIKKPNAIEKTYFLPFNRGHEDNGAAGNRNDKNARGKGKGARTRH